MAKILGVGGIFYRVADPAATRRWYARHLGLVCDEYGANFVWRKPANGREGDRRGYTLWSPFPEDSDYLDPSRRDFMINLAVDDVREMVEHLRSQGVEITSEPVDEGYGVFAQFLDPDGVKVELCQLNPDEYEEISSDSLQ